MTEYEKLQARSLAIVIRLLARIAGVPVRAQGLQADAAVQVAALEEAAARSDDPDA